MNCELIARQDIDSKNCCQSAVILLQLRFMHAGGSRCCLLLGSWAFLQSSEERKTCFNVLGKVMFERRFFFLMILPMHHTYYLQNMKIVQTVGSPTPQAFIQRMIGSRSLFSSLNQTCCFPFIRKCDNLFFLKIFTSKVSLNLFSSFWNLQVMQKNSLDCHNVQQSL